MKNTESIITRLILIGGILIMGYFGSKLLGNYYYQKMILKNNNSQVVSQLHKDIELKTDPYKLAKFGIVLLQTQNQELALASFSRTTELDPKWRDGWLWRGYSELKLGKQKDALTSLKKAENIDPVYPLTYELLTLAYTQTGDTESAKFTQEKLGYLSKTYPTKK